MNASIANLYEPRPKPAIVPEHTGDKYDLCLYDSRLKMLDMCTSITGVVMPVIASASAIDECV